MKMLNKIYVIYVAYVIYVKKPSPAEIFNRA